MTPAPRARRRRAPAGDEGAAALEFALVSMLLISLLFLIFGTAWALWEYQAARATAREAARLASLGIPDASAWKRGVLCIGERNGLARGATSQLTLTFYADATKVGNATMAAPATTGGYVDVQLAYVSAVRGVPFFSELFTAHPGGVLTSSSVARVEQVSLGGVTTGQTLTTTGEGC